MVLGVSFEYMLIYLVYVISFLSLSHERLLLLDTEEIHRVITSSLHSEISSVAWSLRNHFLVPPLIVLRFQNRFCESLQPATFTFA